MEEYYVYITAVGKSYYVKIRSGTKIYVEDLQTMKDLGGRLIKTFIVPSNLSGAVFKMANEFVCEQKAGKDPRLKDLEEKVAQLIGKTQVTQI